MKYIAIGLDIILFVIFLILKLTGCIDWLWFWVLSPIWIPLAIGIYMTILDVVVECLNKLYKVW